MKISDMFSRKKIRQWTVKFLAFRERPERISMAVAVGIFVAFAVPVGFQAVAALALAFILRVPKVIALVFTFPINPYNAPFLYPLIIYVGAKTVRSDLTLKAIESRIQGLFSDFSLMEFLELGWDLLVPFLVGSFVMGIIFGIISYFASYGILVSYRKARRIRLLKRTTVKASEAK